MARCGTIQYTYLRKHILTSIVLVMFFASIANPMVYTTYLLMCDLPDLHTESEIVTHGY